MLSLVFMQTLYLYIEYRIRIHYHAVVLLDILCKGLLVGVLDLGELMEHLFVVFKLGKF